MTARWEPLETAEEVVAAHEAGRKIQCRRLPTRRKWVAPTYTSRDEIMVIEANFVCGTEYRAMIEDSK